MKGKRVLITGGGGFIGSNLVKALVDDNHVTVFDNFSSGYVQNLTGLPIDIYSNDIRDKDILEEAMDGIDVVFHLAASVGNKRSIDFPVNDAEINVIGTLNVLEAMRKNNVHKIVTSSSAGIFGELKTLPIKENHPIEPDSPYGCTKLCEEKLCLSYTKLYDIEAICLRYFNVYGPNQRYDAYGNVIPKFVFNALKDYPITIFGDGDQTRDFVNVHDVVQSNIKAGEVTGVSGAFNIGSGRRVTINVLVDIIKRLSGKGIAVQYDNPRPGDVRDSLADISYAREKFGYEPQVDLGEGLEEYITWAINSLKK